MKIAIDSAIFYLQTNPEQKHSEYWHQFVSDLKWHMPEAQFVLLDRDGSTIRVDGLETELVHAFPFEGNPSSTFDDDAEMLRSVCRNLTVDIVIGTCFTCAPGVINIAIVADFDPNIPGAKTLKLFRHPMLRAVETADAFICLSKHHRSHMSSSFSYIDSRPILTLDDQNGVLYRQTSCQDICAFIQAVADKIKSSIFLTAIVSTYNAEAFIHGCLADLKDQTIEDKLEIIVIDSASEQDEASVVRDFQRRYAHIKYIRTPRRENVYQAWNRGIKFALGRYITNANTDDRHRRDAFEKMIAVLDENDDIALVYADVIKTRTANETFNKCTPTAVFRWPDWNRKALLTQGCFIGPQPVWRKSVHESFGYFDERYDVSSDFEFWLRISQAHDFYHIPQPLGLYLERPDSIEHAHVNKKIKEDKKIISIYQYAEVKKKMFGINPTGEVNDTDPHMPQLLGQPTEKRGPISEYTNFEEMQPGGKNMNSPNTILNAIQYMIEGGQKEAASWALDKLRLDFPDNAGLHNQSGALAYEIGDMEAARGHFEQAVSLSPDNSAYQKNLGDFYYVIEKDAHKALASYERALEIDPQHLETLIIAGHVSISLQRNPEAQQYYQRVLLLDPGNSEIQEMMHKLNGHLQKPPANLMTTEEIHASASDKANAGDLVGAAQLLEQMLGKDCDSAAIHNQLGVLYYEIGNMNSAMEQYEKAAALAPENEIYQKNLADFYWAQCGDHLRAMERYVQVLKLNPQDLEAMISCCQICLTLQKTDDARDFLNTVLEIEPWNEDARHLFDQIETLSMPSHQIEAPEDSKGAYQHHDESVAKELEDAVADLKRQLAQSPDNALLHNNLGVLLYEAGEKAAALASYQQAVRLEPNESNYLKNIADFYMIEEGRADEAMKLYLQVLSQNPEDVEALNATGMICNALGQTDDARYFYQRTLQIEPWNENANNGLKHIQGNSATEGVTNNKDVQSAN